MNTAVWVGAGVALLVFLCVGWQWYQNRQPEYRQQQRSRELQATALQLEGQQRHDAAVDLWLDVLRGEPTPVQATLAENALWRLHPEYPDTQTLIRVYRSLLEQQPNDGALHFKLGVFLHRDGQESAARSHWKQTLHFDGGGWAAQARERLTTVG